MISDTKPSYQELELQVMQLRHELDQLKRLVFGSKHERFVPVASPDQLSIGLDVQSVEPANPITKTIQYTRTSPETKSKVNSGRMTLPASLPREQIIIEPIEDVSGYKKIGEEITEELEATPLKFFVRQYVRPKYARPQGEGVVIGTLPSRPIDKAIAGPGLLATIIIGKFIDHLPVYRQLEQFKRSGITLSASTVSDWIEGTCRLLAPLYEAHRRVVLTQDYIQADETPIKVLDKDKKGTTHRGYHWVYHSPLTKLVLFDYREGRGREGPGECLNNFNGYLQTDGYEVYECFNKKSGITLLHCMAHARRYFDEALDNDKARAEHVLSEIQKLYAIERRIRQGVLSYTQAYELRQQESLTILAGLKEWMLASYSKVLPQSPIGKALAYSLQRWDKLSLYTEDGRLQIDNNLVENAIRPVAVGRKNYLFAGSHEGARRAAMLYSFLGSCKRYEINPFEWLKDVLERLPDYPVNQIEQLLPNNWKQK